MTRTLIAVLFAAVLAPAAWAEFSVFGAGGTQPDPKQKIVDEIQGDLGKVADRLDKSDPGTQTRDGMQRIIDNIDRLLDQQKSNRDNASSSNSPPPKQNASQKPNPANNPSTSPMPEQKPNAQPSVQPKPGEVTKTPTGGRESRDNTNVLQKAKDDPNGPWVLRARPREGMDTYAGEQLMHRYDELTRAYYRSLAENRRRDP